MKYAIMSLESFKLMDHNGEQPLYFKSYGEAGTFIKIYSLTNVAIVQLEKGRNYV